MPELNEAAPPKRRMYQGAYRETLEDPVTQPNEPGDLDGDGSNTSRDGPENPEELTFKKRYGDLRRHTQSLTERIQSLETQLLAAQKKEVKIPSTKEELTDFAQRYPDVYRHIRSIAMSELLQERENVAAETVAVQKDLEKLKRERGEQRILKAHPDFEEMNMSQEFQDWAATQPKQIQDWLFDSDDPDLCIKALDLYKFENGLKRKNRKANQGADQLIPSKNTPNLGEGGNKRVWKASEIRKMHPRDFEKYEDDIDAARREGRWEQDE